MPINANYEYAAAERKFLLAQNDEEKLLALEEMMRTMPTHKGAESLRANLRTRYKKLKEKMETAKAKKKKSSSFSVKKSDMQAVLVGLTGAGKSSILKALTNANPLVAEYAFTTKIPEVGILNYENCQIQIIDVPAIGADSFDTGIINTSDTALLIVENIADIPEVQKVLSKFKGRQIVVFNKIDRYDGSTKRKIHETLRSKKYNFVAVSCIYNEGIEELKEKIFKSFSKIRVYTKSPNEKNPDSSPVIMPPHSLVEDIAKIIFKGNLRVIKKVRIWGPSSKFGGQEVGIKHALKDKDIVEFSTR